MSQRLAAIMSADIVGCSLASGGRSDAVLVRLEASRHDLITAEISKHHGHIFAVSGDNFLTEFASVVEAVGCAIAINAGMTERNADTAEANHVLLRIGIDLGDLTVNEDRISGEGISVARHISRQADPGGLCISLAGCDQVRGKLQHSFDFVGEIEADDLLRPVRVFKLVSSGARRRAWRAGAVGRLAWQGAAATFACMSIALAVFVIVQWEARWADAHGTLVSEQNQSTQATAAFRSFEPDLIQTVIEVTFWNTIRASDDPAVIRTYIDKYPRDQFTALARARLRQLTDESIEGAITEVSVLINDQQESRDAITARWQTQFLAEIRRQVRAELRASREPELTEWRLIRANFEPAVLQRYLIKYPDGAYATLARHQMAAAKRQQLNHLQANLETDPRALLSPDALADEGLTELGLTIMIQQHLARLECDPGRPDGVWGAKSRRALSAFAKHSKARLASLTPSQEVLDALSSRTARVCPLACGPRHRLDGERCALKTCPEGKGLSTSGACVVISDQPPTNVKASGKRCGRCNPYGQSPGVEPTMPIWCGKRYLNGKALGICVDQVRTSKKTTPARQPAKPKAAGKQCAYCWNQQGIGGFKLKYCGAALKRRMALGGGSCDWTYYKGQHKDE